MTLRHDTRGFVSLRLSLIFYVPNLFWSGGVAPLATSTSLRRPLDDLYVCPPLEFTLSASLLTLALFLRNE